MDIVERLREMVLERRARGGGVAVYIDENWTNWIEGAADEIENLREQIPAPAPQ